MKNLIPVILSLLIACTNSEKNSIDDSKNGKIPAIIGTWTICSYDCEGSITQFNICPSVSFYKNGQGRVVTSNSIEENFEWELKDGRLTIQSKRINGLAPFFSDTTFSTKFGMRNNNDNLIIVGKNNNCSYFLSGQSGDINISVIRK